MYMMLIIWILQEDNQCTWFEICLLHTPYYADVNGKDLSCHLYFTKEEEKSYKKKFNLTKPYAIIQSQAKTSYLPKDWGVKNFQEIVKNVRYNWVQVGEKNEKPLKGVVNLCGKTSLREMIYIVTKAAMVVCNEGLLCHVSSVNNTPCLAIIACDIPKKLTQYQNVTHFKGEIDPANIINLIRKTLL